MNENEKTQAQPDEKQEKPNQVKTRLISMLVLVVSFGIAEGVLIALIIGQTLFGLFTKEPNDAMKKLAKQLSDYIYDTLQYLTFNSEERPFPYQGWDETKDNISINSDPA